HPLVSGNKLRKLKYNIFEAQKSHYKGLITFGGAFSNHILAVAACGHELGFETIGFIRGDELKDNWQTNPTLHQASSMGMKFEFLNREQYRKKTDEDFVCTLKNTYPSHYLIPEGGTNELAIKGCEEILTLEDSQYDIICCSVGTGGTIAGIINSASPIQKVFGFASLKGSFLTNDIRKFVTTSNWEMNTDFHFGGYGKITKELIAFCNRIFKSTAVPLDPIYTGKAFFGLNEMVNNGILTNDLKILFIHTGGLQGIKGINQKLAQAGEPVLEYYEN
ncbi:MAG: 1-aminocyclopropane-1-carboxylate deaminase/D-cysteine desulfhydrase, partial [Flavobacterium sp.]